MKHLPHFLAFQLIFILLKRKELLCNQIICDNYKLLSLILCNLNYLKYNQPAVNYHEHKCDSQSVQNTV